MDRFDRFSFRFLSATTSADPYMISVQTSSFHPHRDSKINQLRRSIPSVPSPIGPILGEEELIIHELEASPGAMERSVNESSIPSYPKELDKAIRNAMFIAQHIDNCDEFESVRLLIIIIIFSGKCSKKPRKYTGFIVAVRTRWIQPILS